jgi:hypothetical protein
MSQRRRQVLRYGVLVTVSADAPTRVDLVLRSRGHQLGAVIQAVDPTPLTLRVPLSRSGSGYVRRHRAAPVKVVLRESGRILAVTQVHLR